MDTCLSERQDKKLAYLPTPVWCSRIWTSASEQHRFALKGETETSDSAISLLCWSRAHRCQLSSKRRCLSESKVVLTGSSIDPSSHISRSTLLSSLSWNGARLQVWVLIDLVANANFMSIWWCCSDWKYDQWHVHAHVPGQHLNFLFLCPPRKNIHYTSVKSCNQRLLENQLFIKAEKYQFHWTTVQFLGFVVSLSHLQMDPKKTRAVASFPRIKDNFLCSCACDAWPGKTVNLQGGCLWQ